jgi:predicted metal-binding membrane protein
VTDGRLERLLRRDRAIVLAAIAVIVLLAWLYLFLSGARMAGADGGADVGAGAGAMGGMTMSAAADARMAPWSAADFLLMLAMWAAMMVGMMLPSVAPMLLIYARVVRSAEQRGHPFAATGWFASGYVAAWTAFALLATAAQWLLEQAAMTTPMIAIADRPLAGALMMAAGAYQLTPAKNACLGRCRSPLQFIQSQGGFRPERSASVRMGLKHGAYCIGCCWALMSLLFLGGVMNFLWIAALAAIVLAEKLLPAGPLLARASGAIFLIAGTVLVLGALQGP